MRTLLVGLCLAVFMTGCVDIGTKSESYPLMYSDQKPISIIVVPAINESTAADAGELLNVTVTQPFADHGYYVVPAPIVLEIFRKEGILEGTQVKGIPAKIFRDNFGADAVLFLTITEWDKNYIVIGANVTVGIEYVLLSTQTNEVLWSYTQRIVIDTGSSSGNLLVDLVATAVTTAITDYIPIAYQVHLAAINSMPYGKYHPSTGLDGDQKSVNKAAKDAALGESE
jgi:hypothetical protein